MWLLFQHQPSPVCTQDIKAAASNHSFLLSPPDAAFFHAAIGWHCCHSVVCHSGLHCFTDTVFAWVLVVNNLPVNYAIDNLAFKSFLKNYKNTLSLYSSFIMPQLKKVGGSWGGRLRTLVTVWLIPAGTASPVPNMVSSVCTILFDWAAKVCFSHKKSLGVTVRIVSLITSTETPSASPVYIKEKHHWYCC